MNSASATSQKSKNHIQQSLTLLLRPTHTLSHIPHPLPLDNHPTSHTSQQVTATRAAFSRLLCCSAGGTTSMNSPRCRSIRSTDQFTTRCKVEMNTIVHLYTTGLYAGEIISRDRAGAKCKVWMLNRCRLEHSIIVHIRMRI